MKEKPDLYQYRAQNRKRPDFEFWFDFERDRGESEQVCVEDGKARIFCRLDQSPTPYVFDGVAEEKYVDPQVQYSWFLDRRMSALPT